MILKLHCEEYFECSMREAIIANTSDLDFVLHLVDRLHHSKSLDQASVGLLHRCSYNIAVVFIQKAKLFVGFDS